MQHLKIGDPITQIVMEVVIWNRQVNVNEEMVNRTVLLKHFKRSIYKDNVNLTSTFRSDIEIHKYF